jgi:hypothetical protein
MRFNSNWLKERLQQVDGAITTRIEERHRARVIWHEFTPILPCKVSNTMVVFGESIERRRVPRYYGKWRTVWCWQYRLIGASTCWNEYLRREEDATEDGSIGYVLPNFEGVL